jgi:ABC-type phosphate/phosphonate transport system substrate-binding protein
MIEATFSSLLVAGVTVTFLGMVVTIVPVVSYLRQRKAEKEAADYETRLTVSSPQPDPVVVVPALPPVEPTPKFAFPTMPEMYRLPIREGAPDQIVIMIEPNPGPTVQQRNVQRLIDYLKEEAGRSHGIQSPVATPSTPAS